MDKIFSMCAVKGNVRAISSKSEAHRLLICAALADKECRLICTDTNADIDATASCLNVLGARIERINDVFSVRPIDSIRKDQILDCNESGSTLRFLLPLASALGADCSFSMRASLPSRPLSPLYELLSENGLSLSPMGSNPLQIKGILKAGDYRIAANVSSQYISGMLFALSIAKGESRLTLEGKVESSPYIDMTVASLRRFGKEPYFDRDNGIYKISGGKKLCAPDTITVGGDWSNAAFFLVAGAIGRNPVTVSGLDLDSYQGDKAILSVLEKMGASIKVDNDKITVLPSSLKGIEIDASDIPDLVPIIAVAASVSEGETRIYNAARLRLKESDRIESVCSTLTLLGADVTPTVDGITVRGKSNLEGGEVDSYNDHRIAMSAAIASLVCKSKVTVKRFEAINKSYPSFADNFIL